MNDLTSINDDKIFIVVINPQKKNEFFRKLKEIGQFKICPVTKIPFVSLKQISYSLEIMEKNPKKIEETKLKLDELQLEFLH